MPCFLFQLMLAGHDAKFIKGLQISIYNVTYQLLTCYKVPQTWIIRAVCSPVFLSRGGIVTESQTSYVQLVLFDLWQICDSAESCHFFEKIIKFFIFLLNNSRYYFTCFNFTPSFNDFFPYSFWAFLSQIWPFAGISLLLNTNLVYVADQQYSHLQKLKYWKDE